ncbi:MAG: hypothetical protein EXS13_03955 [Planctomycetes bacterium]|nr:hypothetical protein [Planctomycetota bacterium]
MTDWFEGRLGGWLDGTQRFEFRVLLLVALMVVVAAIDRVRRGAAATRPREYAFVLGLAALGALAGVGFDACTSRIEPAYFIEWKGIAAGPGFDGRVLELGAKAGFGLGLFVAVLLAFANTRRHAPPRAATRRRWSFGQR